jgi:hypothetical protein
MIQNLAERPSRDSKKLRELLVPETAHVPLGNVARGRTHGVAQLIGELELPLECRPGQQLVDVQLQLMGELPSNDLFKLLESGHAEQICKPTADRRRRERGALHRARRD